MALPPLSQDSSGKRQNPGEYPSPPRGVSNARERLGKQLAVATGAGSLKKSANPQQIEQVTGVAFSSRYALGYVVATSSNPHVEIRFATRKSDNREVVVKIRYKPHCFKNPGDELEWRRSIDFMLNIPSNSGLVKIHEVLEDHHAFFVISEKVEGLDLRKLLASQKAGLTWNASRAIIQKLLEAVEHLHSHGAVHKDLKLENIMVDLGSQDIRSENWKPAAVKIVDFDSAGEWTPSSPALRDVVGTDGYLAQEAYMGQYSPQSDMFALGVIAYRLLTGKFPLDDSLFSDKHGVTQCASPKMKQIRSSVRQTEVDWNCEVFKLDTCACDLLQKMMSSVEKRRPACGQALAHRWFSSEWSNKISAAQRARQHRADYYRGGRMDASETSASPPKQASSRPPLLPPHGYRQDGKAEIPQNESQSPRKPKFALPPPAQFGNASASPSNSPKRRAAPKDFGLNALAFKELGPKEFGPKEMGPKSFGPKDDRKTMSNVLGSKASCKAAAADVRAALERPFASGGAGASAGSWKPSCLF